MIVYQGHDYRMSAGFDETAHESVENDENVCCLRSDDEGLQEAASGRWDQRSEDMVMFVVVLLLSMLAVVGLD